MSAQAENSASRPLERPSPRVAVKAILTERLSPRETRELVKKYLPVENR